MKLKHSPDRTSLSRGSGLIVTSAVAAFAAFSLSSSSLFSHTSFDLSLIPRARAAEGVAKSNPLAITSPELRGYIEQAKKISDPVDVLKFVHEVFKFDGGKLGLTKTQNRLGNPKIPDELAKGKKGDCSEVSYGIVEFLVELGRKDIEVGAIFGHLKGAPSEVTHIVPTGRIGGKTYTLDPQSAFGVSAEFDRFEPQTVQQILGNYYRELGDYYRAKGMVWEAIEAYKEAVRLNPKDDEARGQASNLLFDEFNKVRPSLKRENKSEVTKAIGILDDLLFFMPASDPQRARLDRNLQTLKSWVQ